MKVRNSRKPAYGVGTLVSPGNKPGTWLVDWEGREQQRQRACDERHLQLVVVSLSNISPPTAVGQAVQVQGGVHNGRVGTTVYKAGGLLNPAVHGMPVSCSCMAACSACLKSGATECRWGPHGPVL